MAEQLLLSQGLGPCASGFSQTVLICLLLVLTKLWYILIKMYNFEDVSSQRKSKYGEAFLTAKLEKEKCNLCQPVLQAAGSSTKGLITRLK